jgi:hypothetical protein
MPSTPGAPPFWITRLIACLMLFRSRIDSMSRICPVGLSDRRDAINSSELVSLTTAVAGYSKYSLSCFLCCHEFIRSTSLLTSLIYPCHSAGGTVQAFGGVSPPKLWLVSNPVYSCLAGLPTPHMPSADSRIHVKRPLRFAHSLLCLPSRPSLCVPPLSGFGSSMVRSRYSTNAGGFC